MEPEHSSKIMHIIHRFESGVASGRCSNRIEAYAHIEAN